MTPLRVLLAVDEPPGYGGASTVAYQFQRALLARAGVSSLVFLLDPKLGPLYRNLLGPSFANPEGLAGVFTDTPASLPARVADLEPQVLVGFSAPAALMLKQSCPGQLCIFRSPGLAQARFWLHGKARSADRLREILARCEGLRLPTFGAEAEAVRECDYVLPPSPMVRDFYDRFFPSQQGKIARQAFWKARLQRAEIQAQGSSCPFAERDIDLLFSATSWQRWQKNFPLIAEILDRLPRLRVQVAGQLTASQQRQLAGKASWPGHLDRAAHYALLARSRCVAVPSGLDAAPGLLFEAAAMGCNVVASRNCGNFEVCPEAFVCDLSAASFAETIAAALHAPLPSRLEPFYAYDPVTELLAIAQALL